ncbi:MAG: GAF domain-containing protein, partial [Actinobacteria bacterium]|nr:GAF domain-containing protein [Actinomycetota bacterium]
DLLGALLSTIASLLRTDTTAILLVDEETNDLVPRAAAGFDEILRTPVRVPCGKGFAGRIAAERRALTLDDVPDAFVYNSALREKGLKSMLGVPLVVEGRITGVVYVGTLAPRAFTDEDSRLLQLVADRVALAIEQSRLFEAERGARAEAQLAHARLAFLSEATEVLTHSLEYEATLAAVARLAIPTLADWCIVDEIREDGSIARVAVAAASERKQQTLEELRAEYPPSLDSPQPAAQALRSGTTVIFEEFSPESLRATVRDERHWELLSELDPSAAVAIPLVAHGETLGGITFAFAESARLYTPADVALAEEVARRAALAIDRARLYRAERVARLEAERAQDRFAFLAEASEVLTSSLEYEETLERIAALAVPRLADWCMVYMVEEDGEIRRLALQHGDPATREAVAAALAQFPIESGADQGVPRVVRTGEPELHRDATPELMAADVDDPDSFIRVLEPLAIKSWMCVPIGVRGRIVGAISFVSAGSGHRYTEDDVALAQEIARRAGSAVDNARLYREAEERGNAARVLATIADGVFLVDGSGTVRLWNPAAEAVTGIAASEVVGRPLEAAIPGWAAIGPRVPVAAWPAPARTRAETLPFDLDGRELWLSIAGVGFDDGTVYAFRDLTEERRVEELKTEFVATASHELRTPLAAVYGAAMTLRRRDLELDEERRELLLTIIAEEANRLSRTINDILWASRLEAGRLDLDAEPFDPLVCVESVVEAA